MKPLQTLVRISLGLLVAGTFACTEDNEPNGSGGVLYGGGGGGETSTTGTTGSGNTTGGETTVEVRTLPILGNGTHSMSALDASLIIDRSGGLNDPRDLEFNPLSPGELWVINQADNSMTIILNTDTENQDSMKVSTLSGDHFMVKPISLSFGDNGNLATIHETDEITQPSTPPDFMGPTLHSSDLDEFDGGHGGHMDMLHNSPLGMGIAWEETNTYWVFDGYHSSITRYRFNSDHGLGGADHSDGEVDRYMEGQVKRVEGVLSKMFFDHSTNNLYIADTGNGRILTLDTTTGTRGARITPNYDGTRQNMMDDATWAVFADGAANSEFTRPSGLAMYDGVVYVADNANGRISGYDMEGKLIDYLDTGLEEGALMGIAFNTNGDLFYINGDKERLWRVTPKQ